MLTSRFEEALVYAVQLHAQQVRKGENIPYIAHLLSVTALVIENGGGEDESIAALLHDAVEDQGGLATLDEIRLRFGQPVANLVAALTDSYEHPKPDWRDRKERYLEHLRTAPPGVRLISLADKVHNARSLLIDLRNNGPSLWERFTGGRDGTLWYYRTLVEVFQVIETGHLVDELAYLVNEIEQLEARRHRS
jgi:(p)ppGpp synthase/HD superfamily hydrolase